jgi:amino acid transporter
MLWISRLPYVLAQEGYLPGGVGRMSKRATPVRSILICCIVFTLLIPLGFVTLVVIDVFFYMAALALELAAMVRLRKLRPVRGDSFIVGGGRIGLWLIVGAPLVTWVATFGLAVHQNAARPEFAAAIILTASAWPLYRYLNARYGGPR